MKKDYFKIIMQLHAEEGGAPAPASAGSEPAAATPPATQDAAPAAPAPSGTGGEPAAQPAPAAPEPAYKVIADTGLTQLVEDAEGRRRIIDKPQQQPAQPAATEPAPAAPEPKAQGKETTQQGEPPVTPQPAPTPLATQPPAPQPYTLEEMNLAIQMGAVDESRIPVSQLIAYGQYKERMAQQQAIANGQQQAQQQQKPDDVQQRIKFMRDVEATAHEMTLKQLGLTEEDITDSEYNDYSDKPDLKERIDSFKDLKEYNKQRIFSDVTNRQAQARQQAAAQKAVNNEIIAFAQKELQAEPKFNEINAALETYYNEMPYGKAVKYANALQAYKAGTATEAQAKDLLEYYGETKKMVYAKANNLSTTPTPVVRRPASVESPGTGQTIQQQADANDLRNLDYAGKIAWFAKNT